MTTLRDIIEQYGEPLALGSRVRINGHAKKVRRGEVSEGAEGVIDEYNDIGVRLDSGELVRVTPQSIEVID